MQATPLPPIPQTALLSLGGYTCIRPGLWRQYLDLTIKQRYPTYYQEVCLPDREQQAWMENDCVLESIREYMFYEYGLALPEDSLFKVYNPDGQGLLPDQMIDAIDSVIGPFGYEVELILAPDPELRAGLGQPEKVACLSHAGYFEGKAGIAMINIKNGYSHAFFWKKMEAEKFSKEQFRMAVLIRRISPEEMVPRSALTCLAAYIRLLGELPSVQNATTPLIAEITSLAQLIQAQGAQIASDVREGLDRCIAAVEELLFQSRDSYLGIADLEAVIGAGVLVRRIFKEADVTG